MQHKPKLTVRIERITNPGETLSTSDLAALIDIDEDNFDFPWSNNEWQQTLQDPKVEVMLARLDSGEIAGFGVYEVNDKNAVADYHQTREYVLSRGGNWPPDYAMNGPHIRMLNMAVARPYQRQGIGTQIFDAVTEQLSPEMPDITFEVRETNQPALQFFRECCSSSTLTHAPYEDTNEDAIRMYIHKPDIRKRHRTMNNESGGRPR